MSSFHDLRTNTWAFLEAYGWITVFATGLVYVIYKKYIYDLVKDQEEQKKRINQKKFDKEVQEKEGERIRLARERQQEEHDKHEKVERRKREEKEKEIAVKKQKELDERVKTCQVLGHSSNAENETNPSRHNFANSRLDHATEIVNSVPGSAYITVFGQTTCPNFRKVCQLISTYRLDASQFQIFELDKQPDWPVKIVLDLMESRFNAKQSPFVFVRGKFIGGLEEARSYERKYGFNSAE